MPIAPTLPTAHNPHADPLFPRPNGISLRRTVGISTKLYFPPQYAESEARLKLQTIPSIWGHIAGLGINGTNNAFIDAAIRGWLEP